MREPTVQTRPPSQRSLVLPVLRALRLPRRAVSGLAVTAFVSGLGLTVALVLLIQVALRVTASDGATTAVFGLDLTALPLGALFGIAVAAVAVVLGADLLAARQGARIVAAVQLRLRTALFERYNEADWVVQAGDPPGHLQDVMATNVSRALNLTASVNNGLVALLTLATLVGSALVISPLATGVLVVSLVTLVTALTPLARRIRDASEALRSANLEYAVHLAEIAAVPTEIRTFGVTEAAAEAHARSAGRVARRHARVTWLERAIPSLQRNLALITVLAALAAVHGAGLAGVGELGAVVVLLGRSLAYAHATQQTINRFAAAGPFVLALDDEIRRYEASALPVEPSDGLTPIDGAAGLGLSLDSVTYHHPSTAAPALDRVTVDVAPGDYVAIVGPSGSGKTTLAEILLRLRTPDRGRYFAGSVEAAAIPREKWSAAVAFVPQRPALITGTVADNVRFLRDGITDADVERALTAAGLIDDTDALPHATATSLGPAARRLSGGQLQRLAIARALAGRPRLIVLDEPTSALDPDSEAGIGTTLRALAGSVTLVVIAHRATTIDGCDRVVVLEQGRVVAEGRPDEVVGTNTFWHRSLVAAGGAAMAATVTS